MDQQNNISTIKPVVPQQQQQKSNVATKEAEEWNELLKELGVSSSSSSLLLQNQQRIDTNNTATDNKNNNNSSSSNIIQPILVVGGSIALFLNIAMLSSIPPVLRGRGAPYLPIVEKNMIHMFQQLRNTMAVEPLSIYQSNIHHHQRMKQQQPQLYKNIHCSNSNELQQQHHNNHNINEINNHHLNAEQIATNLPIRRTTTFVDLGSGDGRIVFYAAYHTQQLFTNCIGYEINPFLFVYSILKQQYISLYNTIFTSKQKVLPTTKIQFYLQDLWTVNLSNVNVVAVYGLGPIMKELGKKLQRELPNGAYVLSNVFPLPGWKPIQNIPCSINNDTTTSTIRTNTYIYRTPDCWEQQQQSNDDK